MITVHIFEYDGRTMMLFLWKWCCSDIILIVSFTRSLMADLSIPAPYNVVGKNSAKVQLLHESCSY